MVAKGLPLILVSACLAGERTRYDGEIRPAPDHLSVNPPDGWRILPFCPETAGGLTVPRPPSEILKIRATEDIRTRYLIKDENCRDVTEQFIKGAADGLNLALKHNVKIAVLKDGSPSCGTTRIYDGAFSGTKIPGEGVLAWLLRRNGIRCFNENESGQLTIV